MGVVRARLRKKILGPLIGVGLAVIVNAAWIGLLGYSFLSELALGTGWGG